MAEKKYVLTFSQAQASSPLTYRAIKESDIEINILRAEIDERGGKLIVSISGPTEEVRKALGYWEQHQVQVNELDRFVVRDQARCTDCSMCISICPAKAFSIDKATWSIQFDQERCLACGLCVDACPPGALSRGRETLEMT
jgi:formate hydrogenlyase subunit 6/NADH:ubiquinone oxidoreductase subunit I